MKVAVVFLLFVAVVSARNRFHGAATGEAEGTVDFGQSSGPFHQSQGASVSSKAGGSTVGDAASLNEASAGTNQRQTPGSQSQSSHTDAKSDQFSGR